MPLTEPVLVDFPHPALRFISRNTDTSSTVLAYSMSAANL